MISYIELSLWVDWLSEQISLLHFWHSMLCHMFIHFFIAIIIFSLFTELCFQSLFMIFLIFFIRLDLVTEFNLQAQWRPASHWCYHGVWLSAWAALWTYFGCSGSDLSRQSIATWYNCLAARPWVFWVVSQLQFLLHLKFLPFTSLHHPLNGRFSECSRLNAP